MPTDADTVRDLRTDIAIQIDWSLNCGTPISDLLRAAEGRRPYMLIKNLPIVDRRPSPLRLPRVLREASEPISALERELDRSYVRIRPALQRPPLGDKLRQAFPNLTDNSKWSNVTKDRLIAVLDKYASSVEFVLPKRLPLGDIHDATSIYSFLSSATVRRLNDLSMIADVDLADWQPDKDVFKNILSQMANDTHWIQTWIPSTPFNIVTRRKYQNCFSFVILNAVKESLHYDENIWATRRQWRSIGYNVDEFQFGWPVFHFFEVPESNDFVGLRRRVSLVYNAAQVSAVGKKTRSFELKNHVADIDEIDKMVKSHQVHIEHGGYDPHYDLHSDKIVMPPKKLFVGHDASRDYYAILLHEFVHWTGHKDRLGRLYQNHTHAHEELVAEFGAAFLRARFGLEDRHAVNYIQTWYRDLTADLLLDAVGQANKAVNYIIHRGSDANV